MSAPDVKVKVKTAALIFIAVLIASAAYPEATIRLTRSGPDQIRLQEYPPIKRGVHKGMVTRDREAIARFWPVGVWVVRGETLNSPTAGYIYFFKDGTATMLNPNCGGAAHGRWEYEPTDMVLTITEPDGKEHKSTIRGVPWRSRLEADRKEVYVWGQHVWFDSGRFWQFLALTHRLSAKFPRAAPAGAALAKPMRLSILWT